jgi:peptidoglycan-associated lipoprotein
LAEEETIVMRWLFAVVLALSSVTALAQPAPPQDRMEQRREKIKERIRALRAYTLTTELSLDEKTAAKLFPTLAKFDTEFDKLLQQRIDIQRRLDGAGALKDPSSILSKRQVFFDYDKFEVKDEYRPLIEAHAKYLRENPNAKMLIQGNADERGSREYNVALGQRRAESVTKMLVLMGARADQIEAVSWGEEKPRATGHDDSAWSENRRADFAQR